MKKGLVSVIIPYYKKKNYFLRSFNSAYKQSYKKKEIIIIYDDENLEDLKFIKKIIKNKKNIKIIINKNNCGAGESRNIGIKKSNAEFIAFLDSDDVWVKDKIKIQINHMLNKKVNFSFSSYKIIDNKNKIVGLRKVDKNLNYKKLLNSCDIGLSTVIMKKKLFNKKIMFPNIKTKEDYVLWLYLAKMNIEFYGIDKYLVKWRKTENSLSSNICQKLTDGFIVYKKYMNFNYIKSFYHLLILSINYLRKSY